MRKHQKRGRPGEFLKGRSGNPRGRLDGFCSYIREQTAGGKEFVDFVLKALKGEPIGSGVQRRSVLPAAAAVFCVMSLVVGTAVAAVPSDDIRLATEGVLSGADFQRELPFGRAEPGYAGRRAPARRGPQETPEGWTGREPMDVGAPGQLGSMARLFSWTLLFVGLVLVLLWLVNGLPLLMKRSLAGEARPRSDSAADGADDAKEAGWLENADGLASRGAYGEAMHLLLLHSLHDLRRRLGPALTPSLTSREILARMTLPNDALSALSVIVSAVEISYFGGQTPNEVDYHKCRDSYLRFATASGGL